MEAAQGVERLLGTTDRGAYGLSYSERDGWARLEARWRGGFAEAERPRAYAVAHRLNAAGPWPKVYVEEDQALAVVHHPLPLTEAQLRSFTSAGLAAGVEMSAAFAAEFPGRISTEAPAPQSLDLVGARVEPGVTARRWEAWCAEHGEPEGIAADASDAGLLVLEARGNLPGVSEELLNRVNARIDLATAYRDGDSVVARVAVPAGAGLTGEQFDAAARAGIACLRRALRAAGESL
ncbi:hypothetical protein [Corynebacterium mastitidis]|uniref:hypothetical protein n=1 Tax=Corynebacterium mastitidis TaxID=161890 RepID=UPI00254A83D6|nr:hypothetical protein [Corynebacterium mastitidis]MDK8451432.1 hypothetical protein [Corynebacterium mastitidis]